MRQAPPPPQRPAQTATRALGSDVTPADLVTNTPPTMAGRASNAAGRFNLYHGGRRSHGGFRGGAALADSPLLGRLLADLPAVFDAEVLPLLHPTARALLARCGRACRVAPDGYRSPRHVVMAVCHDLKRRGFTGLKVRWICGEQYPPNPTSWTRWCGAPRFLARVAPPG